MSAPALEAEPGKKLFGVASDGKDWPKAAGQLSTAVPVKADRHRSRGNQPVVAESGRTGLKS
jgi:hypothetical protein